MRSPWVLGLLALLAASMTRGGEQPAFAGAKWIWFSADPMPSTIDFPGGPRFFRAKLEVPAGAVVRHAEIAVTADNLFAVQLNGHEAGIGHPDPDAWRNPLRFDLTGKVAAGSNVLAIEALNTAHGPAGLLAVATVDLADGSRLVSATGPDWQASDSETAGWQQPGFEDRSWPVAHVVGDFGMAPWGQVVPPAEAVVWDPSSDAARRTRQAFERWRKQSLHGGGPAWVEEREPPPGFVWPEAVAFVAGDRSLCRPPAHTGTSRDSLNVTIFNPNHSRAFPEHDLPAPVKVGARLMTLRPARPGVAPRVLVDAGAGAIGSPSVSFDGKWVYFSMVPAGEPFFHLYRVAAAGGTPEPLTTGAFHDIDPCELPDGRIAFTSTRSGLFEEYHNTPSRGIFTLDPATGRIHPLTHTFVFDNEPEVLADGRIIVLRSDNFFDRGKVETMLHAFHPDGTHGLTEFGLENHPEYGNRLRAYNVGSPAPLQDGRVAFTTGTTVAIGHPGVTEAQVRHLRVPAGDVAALPGARLLCTLPGETGRKDGTPFARLAILDPDAAGGDSEAAILVHDAGEAIHSPVFLGPRPRPPELARPVDDAKADRPGLTGILYCQNARNTLNTTAGWPHVRAVRVLAGRGLALRSSHSYIVHAGSEVIELGTVPLAPDGSFSVEVPADTAIAFQMVDGEGRSELNEMSWIFVRPGERRGCVGCHASRQSAPVVAAGGLQAMLSPPVRLDGAGDLPRFRGNNAAVTGLTELQFDRYREIAGLNRFALPRQTADTPRAVVAALAATLPAADAGEKRARLARLAVFRDPSAAPAIAACLRDDADRGVRLAAALALATCGTRQSVPPLLETLADPDPVVAQAAALALENLTGEAVAFDAFREQAPRPSQSARWQAWAAALDWNRHEDGLAARLESGTRDDQRRAAVALGHTGSGRSLAAVRAAAARSAADNPFPAWRQDHSHRGDGARFNSLEPVNPRSAQALVRALGRPEANDSVGFLASTAATLSHPESGNLFLAEACIEALARIATPEAESALLDLFPKLPPYVECNRWYGDHDALIACHASPLHGLVLHALDTMASTRAAPIAGPVIASIPTDPDRALFFENDDYETLAGRVIRRSGRGDAVVATCLALLGDDNATAAGPEIAGVLARAHRAWAGQPDQTIRAAQILSCVASDPALAPRVRAAFERFRGRTVTIPRVFDTGIPVVNELPVKHWVCFFLARTLGNLRDPGAVDLLAASLTVSPPEAASGRPDPLGPGVLFLHNDLTPCWRAAAAWALGRIGDPRGSGALVATVADPRNATDTRHAAATALAGCLHPDDLPRVRSLAGSEPELSVRRALEHTLAAGNNTANP